MLLLQRVLHQTLHLAAEWLVLSSFLAPRLHFAYPFCHSIFSKLSQRCLMVETEAQSSKWKRCFSAHSCPRPPLSFSVSAFLCLPPSPSLSHPLFLFLLFSPSLSLSLTLSLSFFHSLTLFLSPLVSVLIYPSLCPCNSGPCVRVCVSVTVYGPALLYVWGRKCGWSRGVIW